MEDFKKNIEERRIMLQWVILAQRPLTISKFQVAIQLQSRISYSSEDLEIRLGTISGGLMELKPSRIAFSGFEDSDTDSGEGAMNSSINVVQLIHQSGKSTYLAIGTTGS